MDRRQFIRNTSLAAAFIGVSPVFNVLENKPKKKKKIIFVFRGVSYQDGFNAFKSFNLQPNTGFHIQKVTCSNTSYSHQEGIEALLKNISRKKVVVCRSELAEKSDIPDIIQWAVTNSSKQTTVIHLHHTEIGHSSNKIFKEKLVEFFTRLSSVYNQETHDVVITADIGRNEKPNSCGGRDHSNASCLETFAIYLGEHASKLSGLNETIYQPDVIRQKF